ncbi:hypothetical protein B7463_g6625, partial [Scytalidium lignicola]
MDSKDHEQAASIPAKNRVIKPNRRSEAAILNRKTLLMLNATLERDPEANILSLLPPTYSDKLEFYLKDAIRMTELRNQRAPRDRRDTRSSLKYTDQVTVLFPLSTELSQLLNPNDLSGTIIDLLDRSEVIFQNRFGASTMVLKVSENIIAKIGREVDGTNEYTSIQYLQNHLPSFPAPRPHGLIKFGIYYLHFMSFIPGFNLEEAWPQLDTPQKQSIRNQLDALFLQLRALPFPNGQPLGGVQGDGCMDGRREIRVSSKPIMNAKEFDDFIFSRTRSAGPIYINFLRKFLEEHDDNSSRCVFTHSDVRPANIMVDLDKCGNWKVTGIVDWERSGFYPEYWESIKVTNNLAFDGDA